MGDDKRHEGLTPSATVETPSGDGDRLASNEEGELQDGKGLVELVLAEHEIRAVRARIEGVLVGAVVSVSARGEPHVDFLGCPGEEGVPARAIGAVTAADIGREVALLFEGGDPSRPVLMGFMQQAIAAESLPASSSPAPSSVEVRRDGERLVLEADKEIVLRCGQAQITLTRAGKILIQGAYLLARSTGVNRIQGGSVQIN
jgi:hypothetical protein